MTSQQADAGIGKFRECDRFGRSVLEAGQGFWWTSDWADCSCGFCRMWANRAGLKSRGLTDIGRTTGYWATLGRLGCHIRLRKHTEIKRSAESLPCAKAENQSLVPPLSLQGTISLCSQVVRIKWNKKRFSLCWNGSREHKWASVRDGLPVLTGRLKCHVTHYS